MKDKKLEANLSMVASRVMAGLNMNGLKFLLPLWLGALTGVTVRCVFAAVAFWITSWFVKEAPVTRRQRIGLFCLGAKQMVQTFREKGRSALCHAVQALRIPSVLSRMGRGFAHAEKSMGQLAVRLDAMREELHQAGGHIKNAGLALAGKEPQESKELSADKGVLAKLRGFGAVSFSQHYHIAFTVQENGSKVAKHPDAEHTAGKNCTLCTFVVCLFQDHVSQQAANKTSYHSKIAVAEEHHD